MGKLIQHSKVKISKEPGKSKIKRAEIEGFPGAIRMGIYGGIAQFFKLSPGGAHGLHAGLHCRGRRRLHDRDRGRRSRSARRERGPDKLQVEAEGRIEDVDGKMILTGIKLRYRLKVPKEKRATVERALEHHEGLCAASESVRRGIIVEWDSEIVGGGGRRSRHNAAATGARSSD